LGFVLLDAVLHDFRTMPHRSKIAMVSVVVSIQMRKMFAEVRKMFLNARDAERDVRERQASRNF